jgi:hypothetical protein
MTDRTSQLPPDPADDAGLRAALKRVAGPHAAPNALRDRVAAALEREVALLGRPQVEVKPAAKPIAPAAVRFRSLVTALVACGLLLAAFAIHRFNNPVSDPIEESRYSLRAMVALHMNADRSPGNEVIALDAATQPSGQVEKTLVQKLGRAMPALAAVGPDFRVKDVLLCTINSARVARISLVSVANAATRLTLISVPADSYVSFPDGSNYDVVVDGKPMSGYASNGGVHCIIGDAGTDPKLLARLRDQLKSTPMIPAQSRACPRSNGQLASR